MNLPTNAELTYIQDNATFVCSCCAYVAPLSFKVVYDSREFCSNECIEATQSDEAITPEERERFEAELWESDCTQLRSIGH